MNLVPFDTCLDALYPRLHWSPTPAAAVSGMEPFFRVSRYLIEDLRDEQGHRLPLRDELWVTVYPPRSGLWRVEGDTTRLVVVGRGTTSSKAISDWQKRFRTIVQRFLEMRPFEMTAEDRETWTLLQSVVDVPQYRATKPIVGRQIGRVAKARGWPHGKAVVVRWEDGEQETVDAYKFDEVFFAFFRDSPLKRSSPAIRRRSRSSAPMRYERCPPDTLPGRNWRRRFWDRVVGLDQAAAAEDQLDEQFWLANPQ